MRDQPPLRSEPAIPPPQDIPYCGRIGLHVDATDVDRCIFQVQETIPVAGPGVMTLLYPKWIPGFHSPAAAIELFAGLEIFAGDLRLAWRRDSVEVHAFHIDVPPGCAAIEARFQFLSPTAATQGTIAVTPVMSAIRWSAMVLYPAGYHARRIEIEPSLSLPEGWGAASSLKATEPDARPLRFPAISMDDLVDVPVLAGRWRRRVDLDAAGEVALSLIADKPELLSFDEAQLAPHRAMVAEADALFGARPFDHYEFLAAVSDEIGGGGVEHHQSSEIVLPADYFTAWDAETPTRSVFAHEYVHAWNGKFRRAADSWTASFEQPIRNSLMWVYEGLTQYWGEVLATRAGLWSRAQALDTLARTAALYANRPGGAWRPMSDTTRDPVIAGREPLPWPSWQRSEDYYAEGQLLWLDVDTLIRELSDDRRSLDDFAKAFFGRVDGRKATSLYRFEDVVAGLEAVAPHDWASFLDDRLERREVGAPLDGLGRGGYQLVYRQTPSDFARLTDSASKVINLRFSIGLTVNAEGLLQEVIWDGPAFKAGAVAGATLEAVNGQAFSVEALQQAVEMSGSTGGLELSLRRGGHLKTGHVDYRGGHRFPHLARIEGARPRVDEILLARAPGSHGAGEHDVSPNQPSRSDEGPASTPAPEQPVTGIVSRPVETYSATIV